MINLEFEKSISDRSIECRQFTGQALDEYHDLKQKSMQKSIKEREEMNGVERNLVIVHEREKEFQEQIQHVQSNIQTLSEESKELETKKQKVLIYISKLAVDQRN